MTPRHATVNVALDATIAIRSLSKAIEAYDSLLAAPRTLMGEHLQTMHGQDINGEWHHAPQPWRKNAMSPDALAYRHAELHDEEVWNEASERHDHG